MASQTRAGPGLGGAIRLLRDPNVGWYFAGKLASTCGMWTQNVAAAILMYEVTQSPLMVGLVSFSQFLGPLLLAIWAGSLSDRIDRRKILFAGRCISGTAVLFLATLIAVKGVGGFGGPAVLIGAVLMLGIGMAISVPAMQALVPSLVEPEQLESALALSSITPSIGRTVGPALGSGLILLGGPALAFGAAGLSHLFFASVLIFIRQRQPQQLPPHRPPLLGGIKYLLSDRKTGSLMLAATALSVGSDAVLTLTPSKVDSIAGSTELAGLLASSFGVGAIVFLLVLGPLRSRTTLRNVSTLGFSLLAIGLACTGLARTALQSAGGVLVAGMGFMMGSVSLNTRIQKRLPDHLRGRVMAIWVVAFIGSRPIAAVINGSIAEMISVPVAFGAGALITAIAIPLLRVRYEHGDRTAMESQSDG